MSEMVMVVLQKGFAHNGIISASCCLPCVGGQNVGSH